MEEISLKAEELFIIGEFVLTNSLLLSFVSVFVLISFALILRRRVKLIPGHLQSATEIVLESFLGLMEGVLGSKKKAERYLPLVFTIFVFILSSNLLGIIPGVGSIFLKKDGTHVPFFRPPAADLNFTLAFAVVSVTMANVLGMTVVGVFKHIGKFINFKGPIQFFVGILEIVSELAKIISLSFRLFGNIFAGEVLLTIIFFLAPYLIPLPFMFLEIFVGIVQAFIFAMITLISIALHTSEEGGH